VMASQDFVIPQTPRQVESLSVSMLVLVSSGVVFLVAASVLSRYFGSLPIVNRLVLKPVSDSPAQGGVRVTAEGKPLPSVQCAVSVGDWGVALTPLRPSGKASFGDEIMDVLTDGTYVDAGRSIRIDEMLGSSILVSEVEQA
jgi:membrane-bound serine protease (ClpP class)